jgi:alkylhydroperoxidase family enzyme
MLTMTRGGIVVFELTDRSTRYCSANLKEKRIMQNLASTPVEALINPRPPVGEEARVEAVLGAVRQKLGFVPDGLRLFSFSPPLLENFVGNVGYFNSGERLSPALMAMIRYLVSWNAGCQFCIDLNEGFLANMGVALERVRAARDNPEAAPVQEKERPLLRIALKSVHAPDTVSSGDLDAARAAGWSDRDIFDVVAQAASNQAFTQVLRTFKIEHQGVYS